jgi:hypothetical protein
MIYGLNMDNIYKTINLNTINKSIKLKRHILIKSIIIKKLLSKNNKI